MKTITTTFVKTERYRVRVTIPDNLATETKFGETYIILPEDQKQGHDWRGLNVLLCLQSAADRGLVSAESVT